MQVGQSFSIDCSSRSRPVLVPRTSARLRPRDGPVRQHRGRPIGPRLWPGAPEELLTLDDVLLEDGQIASFSRTETTYVAMGRFGNTMLIGGDVAAELSADLGEVVRFYFTNTANTRVFNVGFDNARMKLVGGDSGRVEHEAFVSEVILAPSERIVVDVLFDQPGHVSFEHRHPERTYPLASVTVGETPAEPELSKQFEVLRTTRHDSERDRLVQYRDVARTRRSRLSLKWTWEYPAHRLLLPHAPAVIAR